jgi:hypothetical protein
MSTKTSARRARGAVLIAGGAGTLALVEGGVVARYWLVLLVGLVYLAAAAAGRSRDGLWAPGLVVTPVGLTIGLWIDAGRPFDTFQLACLLLLSVGAGTVLAGLLDQRPGFSISPLSLAVPPLLLGGAFLVDQQQVEPLAGETWPYAVLLVLWGLYELRPGR